MKTLIKYDPNGCIYDEEGINYDDQDWYGDNMYPYEDCGGGCDDEGED